MSRIAKKPIELPSGLEVKLHGQMISIKGSKGISELNVHSSVKVIEEGNTLVFSTADAANNSAWAMAGTMRSLVNNMVIGTSEGFEKKLELVGVGYRAKAKGNTLNLTLGFSHPVNYQLPEGVTVETPKQTEIIVRGVDKQKVGQVAAEIRAYRPPEPYKGKGVKYADEHIIRKQAKKK
ncbi:MAG: 50S ribosomal protein L6 [Cocleimonas sp.]|nr:50S ribosomal protein L6 [Cocleimonas sp.]